MEVGNIFCFVRRIWAHEISIFVPHPRDIAHPGSGSAQSLLRIGSGLLNLITIFGRLRYGMLNCFNCDLEKVPLTKVEEYSS